MRGVANYREMAISDYQQSFSLWRKTEGVGLRFADSTAGIESYLTRNPGMSFVAVIEGKVIGTIMAGHDGRRGSVHHLAVDEACRDAGVGQQLIALSLAALKAAGIFKSHIHVFTSNAHAQQYWLNRGWSERADIKVFSYINDTDENV